MDKNKKLKDIEKGFLNRNSQSVKDKLKAIVPFGGNTATAGKPNGQYDNKKQRDYGQGY